MVRAGASPPMRTAPADSLVHVAVCSPMANLKSSDKNIFPIVNHAAGEEGRFVGPGVCRSPEATIYDTLEGTDSLSFQLSTVAPALIKFSTVGCMLIL